MIQRFIARFGTLGVVLLLVAVVLLGGVGGGLFEHVRLAATQEQQQGEQSGNQQEGRSGNQQEGQSGTQGESQDHNDTGDSQQGEQS